MAAWDDVIDFDNVGEVAVGAERMAQAAPDDRR